MYAVRTRTFSASSIAFSLGEKDLVGLITLSMNLDSEPPHVNVEQGMRFWKGIHAAKAC